YDVLANARDTLLSALLDRYEQDIITLYERLRVSLPAIEGISPQEIGTRAYMGSLLALLSYSHNIDNITHIAETQYKLSQTMTLRLSALSLLDSISIGNRHTYIQQFIDTYQDNPLVIMKYFSIVGGSQHESVVINVGNTQNEIFYQKNLPNHAKALFGAFTRNLEFFHKKDGTGYALITEFIINIDSINPHTAARMAGAFKIYPKLNLLSQDTMRPYLEKILQKEGLSVNTTEIIEKILHYSK
ncbi:aminopeptidase N C-terminal domain-containing protein, partial [Candidatus Gracilibacteria bacterium]|nr:aminopeptidase N C-terminal domain-containing protein [Candidatus Gracilibacteria bacterium]